MMQRSQITDGSVTPAAEPQRALILVVEDDADNAFVLGQLLNLIGFRAHIVGDGAEALRFLEVTMPDAILSDIRMNKMNGLELAASIRSSEVHRALPMIAYTALGSDRDREAMHQAGFESILLKPATLEELEQCIFRALRRFHSQQL